ncbi:MAG: tetratricopeptide repeat protein [Calothrix sp. MO_167.B42]|nr:tetratricopeptide repeat protein [Calothrix sp. MO_167.B42]
MFFGFGKYRLIGKLTRGQSMWKDGCNSNLNNTMPVYPSDTEQNGESNNQECNKGNQELLITACSQLQKGIEQHKNGNLKVAMAFLQESWKKFQVLEDLSQQIKALRYLTLVAYNHGDYKIVINYGTECLSLKPEPKIQQQILSYIGNAYRHIGYYEPAIQYLSQCLEIAKQLNDKKSWVAALNNLGLVYKFSGNLPLAINFYEQSLTILQELQDQWGEEQVLKNLGDAYYGLNDYNKAIDYFQKSIQIAQSLNRPRNVVRLFKNLATTYYALGDYAQVIACYEQRLKLAQELGDTRTQEQSLRNLGIACEANGDYRQAITYYEERLELARETQDSRSEKQTLASLKAAYYALGEYTALMEFE